MANIYTPLAPNEEDALHRARLLNTEERALRRVTKRFLAPNAFDPTSKHAEPASAEEATGDDGDVETLQVRKAEEYAKLREDILLDFAAFEANLIRTQLLLNSNAKERERYAAEKLRIQETAQQVRDSTAELRVRLEDAQRTMEMRKGWDRLAEKITNNRMLKTREEQQANIEKLNNEIEELKQESSVYGENWAERRQQFQRIVDEGTQMLHLIRDEKEEVERREGMEEREDGDDGEAAPGPGTSRRGTPLPERGTTPMQAAAESEPGDGLLHPQAKTPARDSLAPTAEREAGSPAVQDEDADMSDEGEVEDDPEEEEGEEDDDDDGQEDGEEGEDDEDEDEDEDEADVKSKETNDVADSVMEES